MGIVYDIDSFLPWLTEIINASGQPFVKSAPNMIAYFFQLDKEIPDVVNWRYYDVKAFRDLIENNKVSTSRINNTYWCDVIGIIEAYGMCTYFRTNEILRTSIRSLNRGEITPSAILARSLLELGSTMIENANTFNKTIESLIVKDNTVTMGSLEFEELLLKLIWGTRLIEEIPEYLKQKNILTIIQKVSKHPTASDLIKKYEFLGNILHFFRVTSN